METSLYRAVVMTFFAYLTFVIASLVCKCFSELSLYLLSIITSFFVCNVYLVLVALLFLFSSGVWITKRQQQQDLFRNLFSFWCDDHCLCLSKRREVIRHPSKLVQVHTDCAYFYYSVNSSFYISITDVRTISALISFRVLNACSIDKERVFLEEELKILACWSLTFQFHHPVLVAVQLPADVFVFRPKDFLFLLPADLIFVSLVEMKIWSSLHRGTTISTSGLCPTAKATRFLLTNHYSSCVDTHRQSTPSDTTPATMSLLLQVKRRLSSCGPLSRSEHKFSYWIDHFYSNNCFFWIVWLLVLMYDLLAQWSWTISWPFNQIVGYNTRLKMVNGFTARQFKFIWMNEYWYSFSSRLF